MGKVDDRDHEGDVGVVGVIGMEGTVGVLGGVRVGAIVRLRRRDAEEESE